MKKTIGVKLDQETLELLEKKLKKEGKSKSKILKELVVNYISGSGLGGEASQNVTKNEGSGKKKPVNASSGHGESHAETVKNDMGYQPGPQKHHEEGKISHVAKSSIEEQLKPKEEIKELKPQVPTLVSHNIIQSKTSVKSKNSGKGYVNHEFDHSTKTKSNRDFWKVFTIIALIGGVVAIGYFAYKAYFGRSIEFEEDNQPRVEMSPQALSYISR